MSRKKESSYITEQRPFPTRLRQLMKEKGDTQKALADAIGIMPQTVSLYSIGQSSPNADTLTKIANHYNVTVDYLLGIPGSPRNYDDDVSKAASALGISESAAKFLHDYTHKDLLGKVLTNRLFRSALAEIWIASGCIREMGGFVDEENKLLDDEFEILDVGVVVPFSTALNSWIKSAGLTFELLASAILYGKDDTDANNP